ncbi:MAG: RNA polymerase sigma factor [Phycisphaerae bacterium]
MSRPERPLFTEDTGRRDAAWVEAAIAGDTSAFGRLVEAYQRPAVSKAYRLLGNSEDAAEVVQEAFLRAYRALKRLKDPHRFGPWMMRIVSNLSLNARRSRRAGVVPLEEERGTAGVTTGEGEPVVAAFGPDSQAQGREMQEALDAALATLPEKQRLSLVLFTIEGWAQKDIAEFLECSIENVKWNVFQARRRLRDMLGDMLEGQ